MHRTFFKHDMRTRVDDRKAEAREAEQTWRAVCKAVNERDGLRCRCCGVRVNPEALSMLGKGHHHHIQLRSDVGPDTTANVVLLDAQCHDAVHVKRTLHIEGNADVALTFSRRDESGHWYIWRQETGVRVVERD